MIDKEFTFVLIAKVLKSENRPFVHAAKAGPPVTSRSAYDTDGVMRLARSGRGTPALLVPQAPAVFVECTLRSHAPVLRVDHHNPGDAGYAMPPARYLEGASVGADAALSAIDLALRAASWVPRNFPLAAGVATVWAWARSAAVRWCSR